MGGCTGRCNQGRSCTCFEGPAYHFRAGALLLEFLIAALATACGFVWAQSAAAKDCEAVGHFRAWGAVYECSVKARP